MEDLRKQQRHMRRSTGLYRAFCELYQKLIIDEPLLADFCVTRAELSPDKSTLSLYFADLGVTQEQPSFDEALEVLKLYRASLRKAIGTKVRLRYLPQLLFKFDKTKDKQRRVEDILDSLSREGDVSDKPGSN